jgi:glycosyltransferase involved in cell wall biosynthesis
LFIVPWPCAGTGTAWAKARKRGSKIRLEVSTLPAATAAGGRALTRHPSGARTVTGTSAPAPDCDGHTELELVVRRLEQLARLVATVRKRGDAGPDPPLGVRDELAHRGDDLVPAAPDAELCHPRGAEPLCRELGAQVATALVGVPHLCDEGVERDVVEPRRRDHDALLGERARVGRHAPRHAAAHVGVVRPRRGEAELRPGDEGDVRQVRAACVRVPPTSIPRMATKGIYGPSSIDRVKLLLVTLYWPPAGGGGVQRPLKFAQYLPALGIETHVLAPDDPKWIHEDADLRQPTQAWVHRARYIGPKGRRPAEELHGKQGLERALVHAKLASRRLLVPDENVSWNLTAIPAAIRIARSEGIDAVLTTSPPNSVHLVGAAVKKATGAKWVADLRDSLVAHPHRRAESMAVRAKEKVDDGVARLVARSADAITCVSDAIAEEARGFSPKGKVVSMSNGCDFDDFAGLDYTPGERFRITHTGSFFGKRDPRPFLTALDESGLDVRARFLGDFRSADREWAEERGLDDRLELIPYAPRQASLELQRDSEALLLLIPDAGGRGKGVLSGKVFEYLAAERPILALVPPDGAAADLIRETGAGVVAPPDDVEAIKAALAELHARFGNGGLAATDIPEDMRYRLSRRARAEELAELLQSL